jgi:hypothetical protein
VATLKLMANTDGKKGEDGVPGINDDEDQRKADSAFDDLVIEVDEEEVKAESENQPDGRKY